MVLDSKNLFNFLKQKGHGIQLIKEGSIDDFDKKPDLVITNQAWWNIENKIGKEAIKNNI